MKRIIVPLALFVLIMNIPGCGRHYQYSQNSYNLIRHSYQKNYTLGEIKTAHIGETIAKVKDYYVNKTSETTYLTPSEDFILTANVPTIFSVYKLNITGQKNKKYEAYYKIEDDGISYDLMYFPDSNGRYSYGVLIDNEGKIKNNAVYGYKPTDFKLQPANVKFNKVTDIATQNIDNFGDVNFELIYSGINNISMNIIYREYTRADYARPSFYQNLTYEPNARQIRFKDLVIDVMKATNDKIVYKIISDGLKDDVFNDGEDQNYERIKSSQSSKK